MIRFEIKKAITPKIGIFLLLINVLFVVIFSVRLNGIRSGHETAGFRAVGSRFEGKVTEETLQEIKRVYIEMEQVLSAEEEKREQYLTGIIDNSEYLAYLDSLHYYKSNHRIIEKLKAKIERAYEFHGEYIFDGYYNYFLNLSRLPWLMWLSAFITALMFAYTGKTALLSVEKTTTKGLKYLYRVKKRTLTLCECVIGLLFPLEELIVFRLMGALNKLSSPIASVEKLQGFSNYIDMPILGFILVRMALMSASCILIGRIICLLTALKE